MHIHLMRLINVLATIQKLRKGHEQVITVVGCGGDRDKTKRPVMAEAACEYSNKVIFTSDNPRSEDPLEILKDMEAGLSYSSKEKIYFNCRQERSDQNSSESCKAEDIVLCRKGHEKYQEIKGVKYPFDDKQVLLEMFEY